MRLLRSILLNPWTLLPLLGLAFFWQLGDTALYDLDEGAFSEATREMFERGDFAATWLNGEPRYDKPILFYWLQAAAALPLGFTELAFRLPSALAASLWVGVLYAFGRRHLDRDAGVVAAWLLAGSLMVLINARAATADALLNLLLTLSLFDIYRYYLEPGRRALLRVWLWLALGLLTKGPVALVIPLLASGLFFGVEGRARDWLRAVSYPAGWLLLLALTVPWLLAVYRSQGMGFFEGFLLEHNLGRFQETMEGHGGSLFYYVVAAPLILLPFTGWLLRVLPRLRQDWADPLGRFLWIWFLVVFVLFSLSSTQLPHYLLYGTVPLVLLMARHRALLTGRILAFLPPVLFLGVLLALPDLVDWAGAAPTVKPQVREMLALGPEVLGAGYRAAVAAGLVVVVGVALWRRIPPWQGLLLAGLVSILVVNGAFRPAFFGIYQQPVKEAGLLARSLGGPAVAYQSSYPSFSVYRGAVTPRRDPAPGDLVLLRADRLERLAAAFPDEPLQVLYRRGGVLLLRFGEGPG